MVFKGCAVVNTVKCANRNGKGLQTEEATNSKIGSD